jgi:DNA primase
MTDSPIDEIKQRLDIVDVLSEYIKLTGSGVNFKCRCPFHSEKTPSFFVSREKQIWHCFGCGKGGDIFGFVQEMEGIEFSEALKILAKKANVVLRPKDPILQSQKAKLMDICKIAGNVYHKILLEHPSAEKARNYLKERKVSDEIIEEFKLGYAPTAWETLNNYLTKKGFKEEDVFLAGLTIKKEKGIGFYDRFRGRIIFPINDVLGNVIGFTGRVLEKPEGMKEEDIPKYVNTPQTLIYDKSRVLYGLDKAKNSIKKEKLAVIVEGNMDCLASHQAEVKNVVASSGTALTLEQVKLLKRYTNNLAIAFDMDPAGEDAAKRGIDQALAQEMEIKVIQLPFGKDPDECIKKDVNAWKEAIKNSKTLMDFYFDSVTKKINPEKVEDKKMAAKILLPIIAKLAHPIERNHYLQKLSLLIKTDEEILRDTYNNFVKAKKMKKLSQEEGHETKDRMTQLSERIVGIGLRFPENLPYLIENIEAECLSPDLDSLYKRLIIYYTNKHEFEFDDFKREIEAEDKNLAKKVDFLYLLCEKDFSAIPEEEIKKELINIVNPLKKNYISNKLKSLEQEIKKAEQETKDKSQLKKLVEEFNQLAEQLREFR